MIDRLKEDQLKKLKDSYYAYEKDARHFAGRWWQNAEKAEACRVELARQGIDL